ncbi:MAG: VWA domain-containing protein [Planctomycetaceae bacterium]
MNDELSKQVSLSFTEAPLTEVLQHLATDAKINLMIDERSLSEIGLTSQVPITINVEGIKLKSALNLILKPMRLDYRVDDGVLVISSTYQHNFESYAPIVENPFTSPVDAPLSTFGLDVDTASYANVRRFLLDEGRLPPPDAVRIEELVNSFSYDDPQPVDEHPLRVSLESAACPWDATHRLVRIGVKGKEIDLADRPPTSLVLLIDTSGSMRDDNKLPLVKESLRLLVDEMSENDRIAIVTYSNDAGLLLDSTSGEHRDEIMSIIDSLSAGGSTNGEAGLKTAYEVATQHKIDNGSNRVILCTDGDFNVGESADAPLVQMISGKRDTGVFLSIFGFGTGNLKDAKLEQIADHGNGHYHYIDGLRQARKVFLDELTGMLYTIAQDVKLQIEFNPAHVGAYRLIGYENRTLAAEDFNNDQIDAGDLGAGHSVCALYEIVPPHALPMRQPNEPNVDPLKYQPAESQETRAESKDASKTAPAIEPDSQPSTTNPQLSSDLPATPEELRTVLDIIAKEKQAFEQHTKELQEEFGAEHLGVIAARKQMQELQSRIRQLERHQLELNEATPRTVSPDLLTVKLRYKRPTFFTSQKLEFPLIDDPDKQSRSNNLEWSAAVASFGMLLRNSAYLGNAKFDSVLELARDAMGDDRSGQRAEFIDMVLRARQLHRQSHGTDSPPPPELSSLEARRKASLDGRYEDLAGQNPAARGLQTIRAFHNRGWWTGPQDADEKGYPAGYWVYVYPHWYVWSETVSFDSPSSSRKRNPLGRPPVDSH